MYFVLREDISATTPTAIRDAAKCARPPWDGTRRTRRSNNRSRTRDIWRRYTAKWINAPLVLAWHLGKQQSRLSDQSVQQQTGPSKDPTGADGGKRPCCTSRCVNPFDGARRDNKLLLGENEKENETNGGEIALRIRSWGAFKRLSVAISLSKNREPVRAARHSVKWHVWLRGLRCMAGNRELTGSSKWSKVITTSFGATLPRPRNPDNSHKVFWNRSGRLERANSSEKLTAVGRDQRAFKSAISTRDIGNQQQTTSNTTSFYVCFRGFIFG